MRNLFLALVVAGLLAAPSLGVINIKLTASKTTLDNSGTDSAVISLWAQGTVAGIFAAGGDIVAAGDSVLNVPDTGMQWEWTFAPTFGLTAKPGTPGPNGTVINWGSEQTNYLSPEPWWGRTDYIRLGGYTVVATGGAQGAVTLTVFPKTVSGYKFIETDKTMVMGQNIPVTINVTPEPVTAALLALGGIAVLRRRRCTV